jgi:predicted amidohydrolase YtcJ
MLKSQTTKRLILFGLSVCFFSAAAPAMSQSSHEEADILVTNGAIYTMDSARTWAQALAVKNGKIVFVGTTSGAQKFKGSKTKVVELNGKMVMPGLHDSHVHLIDGGVDLGTCALLDCKTRDAVFKKIKEFADAHKDLKWIRGSGWNLPVFKDGHPKKKELDDIVGDRPAWFESQDYHSGWANTKALELAGITKDTKDPEGGRIERDSKGEPTGCLRESAMKLVSQKVPEREDKEYFLGLERGQKLANSFGITSIQDAWTGDKLLNAYNQYDQQDKLTVKVTTAIEVKADGADEQIKQLLEKKKATKGKRLRVTSAKLFADGVIEACTAALLAPYRGRDGDSGKLLFTPEQMNNAVEKLASEGVQVHIHAIGDRAVRTSLDAFENAQKKNGGIELRHHIAHLEMVTAQDIPRFRKLHVCPNVQPFWAQQDAYIKDLTEPVLGKDRSQHLYPIGSLAASGAVLVAGSDWPVSSLNPFDAIEVSIRRREPGNTKISAWLPDEAADLATMLAAYTINGAYVQHQDKETGSLEVGKAADFIVLDRNLFEIPTEEIHSTTVLWTVLDGNEVHRHSSFNNGN